jgi:RNA polymerase sigma factor (sigma-70 family)
VPLLRLRTDDQLVALFRGGNDEAFRVIHDRYRQRLFAYVRQMLWAGPRHDAEDLLQDVFVRAYGALRADTRDVNLRAWLYRVAHNRCIDHLRRPVPPAVDVFEVSRKPLRDPIEEAQRREDLARLVEDVGRLPEQQRSALLMREMDGMSHIDLAATLDVTVPAVKSLLVRARVGLVEAAEARDADCEDIRTDLLGSYDRGVKASARARRHMRHCRGCREYRTNLRGVRRSFAALNAGPLALALVKLIGVGSGGSATTGGGAATTGTAAAASGGGAAATGGGAATIGGGTATIGGGAAAAGGGAAAAGGGAATIGGGAAATGGGAATIGGGAAAAGGGAAATGGGAATIGGVATVGGAAVAVGGSAAGSAVTIGACKVAAVVCTAALTAGGAVEVRERVRERPAPDPPARVVKAAAATPAISAPVRERPVRETQPAPTAPAADEQAPPQAEPAAEPAAEESKPLLASGKSGGVQAPPAEEPVPADEDDAVAPKPLDEAAPPAGSDSEAPVTGNGAAPAHPTAVPAAETPPPSGR